jgi:hypothetical protein
MENLSRPVGSVKIPLTVAIPDYLRDHRYDGRIVLPAAEALQILARSLPEGLSHRDTCLQEGAEFTHLLPLDPDADSFGAFHEIDVSPDGRRLSRLTTLRTGRQTRWTRGIEHVSVCFLPFGDKNGGKEEGTEKMRDSSLFFLKNRELSPFSNKLAAERPQRRLFEREARVTSLQRSEEVQGRKMSSARRDLFFQRSLSEAMEKEEPPFSFSCRRLYADLVPFGPAYHNVAGDVSLDHAGATATVSGGNFREAVGPLGSPFPLDAAMHVACAWGQRYRGIVAFPVGFDRREIIYPTSVGETYRCRAFPIEDPGAVLRFDIGLFGTDGRPVEVVLGLRMRDISGGRLKAPAWVREGFECA